MALAPAAGSSWTVRRLDRDASYLLQHADGALRCTDAATGALLASASSARAPVALTADMAVTQAALGGGSAELVWQPCAATLSMFDPLWRVHHDGREAFVDQRGRRWPTLPAAGPGGGPHQSGA